MIKIEENTATAIAAIVSLRKQGYDAVGYSTSGHYIYGCFQEDIPEAEVAVDLYARIDNDHTERAIKFCIWSIEEGLALPS
jgi:hypothetical protein